MDAFVHAPCMQSRELDATLAVSDDGPILTMVWGPTLWLGTIPRSPG